MIEVIKSPQPVVEKTQWTVFLAGPMNGAPSWQAQAPKVAEKVGIENLTLLNPRKTERFVTSTYQVNWETFGLRMCDVILFWIPPQAREMKPHRIYAITTRLEMAENLARGHRVIIGVDPHCDDLAGIHHLKGMAKYYGVKKIHTTLEDCMKELKAWMERPSKEEERIHHMPGPQFEPMGTLNRVPQPNTNRNQTLMESRKLQAAPCLTVYEDGDLRAEEWKASLTRNIKGG